MREMQFNLTDRSRRRRIGQAEIEEALEVSKERLGTLAVYVQVVSWKIKAVLDSCNPAAFGSAGYEMRLHHQKCV
jgi:hypothetical protein